MPKVVDHDRRRRELAGVVWELIAREGIEGVSIRDVAAAAGWSSGALRHYFATKEELLSYAADLVIERVTERVQRASPAASLRQAVRAILVELLPLDGDRQTEARIWHSFVTRSLVDPAFAGRQRIVFDELHDLCRRLVDEVARHGQLGEGLVAGQEADQMHALLDGLSLHLLLGRLGPSGAEAALDAYLAGLISER
ncbi:MAG: TetR family transcriptional regulator C-terminal domain-containing protein [Candidatus Dormibacteraeota bacterium]|nr:TetR family transcriptional regulator C-terminal domain-containing protein [Candidatus Dormibacteraeota bacterium]MBO0760695.1 TetR family transcriptional regulator C-terminal domain-containing protein [Candidatus Dormibacteraeota bacterium]